MWPLTRVYAPVCHQVGALIEGLAALSTGMRLLAHVHVPVQHQVHALAEGTPRHANGFSPVCVLQCRVKVEQ